jgi:hypothetical protein
MKLATLLMTPWDDRPAEAGPPNSGPLLEGRLQPAGSSPPIDRKAVLALGMTLLLALPLAAQQRVASSDAGVVLAHDGKLELFDDTLQRQWTADGVAYPGAIVHDAAEVAVLDPIGNYVRIADLRSGVTREWRTGATPIEGAFAGGKLLVLCRDEQTLERSDGVKLKLGVTADLLRERDGRIYLYGRVAGVLIEIDPASMTIVQQVTIEPFASDFEVDQHHLYLTYPQLRELHTFQRQPLLQIGDMRVGARPVDIELGTEPTPLGVRRIFIADPVMKRVHAVKGYQTTSRAVAYGLVRGAAFGPSPARPFVGEFDQAIDRVAARGARAIAYETVSGTLYRLSKKKPLKLAVGVAPGAYALTKTTIVWWDGSALRQLPF